MSFLLQKQIETHMAALSGKSFGGGNKQRKRQEAQRRPERKR